MTFVFIQYPLFCMLYLLTFFAAFKTLPYRQDTWIFSFFSGIFDVFLLLLGLYYAIPLSELLMLLLVLILVYMLHFCKGGTT